MNLKGMWHLKMINGRASLSGKIVFRFIILCSGVNNEFGVCFYCMDGTVLAIAGFQHLDFIQKAVKFLLRCMLSVIFKGSNYNPVTGRVLPMLLHFAILCVVGSNPRLVKKKRKEKKKKLVASV